MRILPAIYKWAEVQDPETGELVRAMLPERRYRKLCATQFESDETYALGLEENHNDKSRGHYFASVRECFDQLPEQHSGRFPSPDHLRAWGLIQAGFCNEQVFDCESELYAKRLALFIRKELPMAVIIIRGKNVKIYTAKSQAKDAMKKAEFEESKKKVLPIIWALVGISAGQGTKHAGRSA